MAERSVSQPPPGWSITTRRRWFGRIEGRGVGRPAATPVALELQVHHRGWFLTRAQVERKLIALAWGVAVQGRGESVGVPDRDRVPMSMQRSDRDEIPTAVRDLISKREA